MRSTLRIVKERGCEYCRDDSNMLFGHVEQIGTNDELGCLLLRCPRCKWLYEKDWRDDPIHISSESAHERYAFEA